MQLVSHRALLIAYIQLVADMTPCVKLDCIFGFQMACYAEFYEGKRTSTSRAVDHGAMSETLSRSPAPEFS